MDGISSRSPARAIWSQTKAPAIVVTSIVSTQIGATVAIHLFARAGVPGTVFLRLGFAALILGLLIRPSWRNLNLGVRSRGAGVALLFGLTLAAMNLTFYEGVSRVPLGIAVTLEFVGPLGVAAIGFRRARDIIWLVLAATGVVLLAPWGGLHVDALGIALVLFAGGCWGLYIMLSHRLGQAFPDTTGLILALIVAAAVLAPAGIVSAQSRLLDPHVLVAGVAVATLSSVVTYSFELSALRLMGPATFGVLMSLEPAVAALAGLALLSQSIQPRAMVAIACVVVASAGASWYSTREASPPVG